MIKSIATRESRKEYIFNWKISEVVYKLLLDDLIDIL